MILCLAAGFGVSFALRAGDPGGKTRTKVALIETTTGSSAPSRSRTLHLESLWSQRGGTFQTAAASQRVLAAVTSGNWNDASKKGAVALLLKDPGFINTIWNKADPATRNAMMGELIKVLTQDTPVTSLEVLDAGKFDFSHIPEIGQRGLVHVHDRPERGLRTALRRDRAL